MKQNRFQNTWAYGFGSKVQKAIEWIKIVSSTNGVEQLDICMQNNKKEKKI